MNLSCTGSPVKDVHGDGRWMSMHARYIEDGKLLKPNVVFIGDSIILQMQDTEAWNHYFKPMHAVNFGIGGDTTENVLWRLENGELDVVNPKVFVILVGTNNYHSTVEEIVDGLETIAWTVYEKRPQSKIVILGLLPRGQKPNKLREKHLEVNLALERVVATIPNTSFLNADPGFVNSRGLITPTDMPDYLHLSRSAYSKLCNLIHNHINKVTNS